MVVPRLRSLFLAACLAAPAAAGEHPGRAYFDAAGCRSCHRVGPVGGTAGPDLSFVGFRRGRDWLDLWLRDPRSWKHDTLMPDFRLAPETRRVVVDYLASRRGQDLPQRPWDAPGLAADPPRRGRILYERAGCVACHGPAGRGGHPNNNVPGGLIPALAQTARTYTPAELVSKIRRGVQPEPADRGAPAPMAAMPAWGELLSDGELEAVTSYLLSLGRTAAAGESDW